MMASCRIIAPSRLRSISAAVHRDATGGVAGVAAVHRGRATGGVTSVAVAETVNIFTRFKCKNLY